VSERAASRYEQATALETGGRGRGVEGRVMRDGEGMGDRMGDEEKQQSSPEGERETGGVGRQRMSTAGQQGRSK
jgi:hypothetical protein